jgi:hypothetical protein
MDSRAAVVSNMSCSEGAKLIVDLVFTERCLSKRPDEMLRTFRGKLCFLLLKCSGSLLVLACEDLRTKQICFGIYFHFLVYFPRIQL